jgi:homoserine kinase type II
MSVYTTVTQAELESWLAQYTLGQLVELKGIAAGITNTNYFVTTTRAAMCLPCLKRSSWKSCPTI